VEVKQGGLWHGQKKPRFGALLGHYIVFKKLKGLCNVTYHHFMDIWHKSP